MLNEEYGANVNEWYERDSPMHKRWSREKISTALYEAVRNNFPSMVELLLEKGADPTVKGHSGMTLMECAWNNKHSGMVRLLRERRVPEGPATKGKDLSTMNSETPRRRTPTPARIVRSSDSSDDDSDSEEREMLMYAAIQP
jgi:ankyrin repeat protein